MFEVPTLKWREQKPGASVCKNEISWTLRRRSLCGLCEPPHEAADTSASHGNNNDLCLPHYQIIATIIHFS